MTDESKKEIEMDSDAPQTRGEGQGPEAGQGLDSVALNLGIKMKNAHGGPGRTPILPKSHDYSDWSQLAELILEAEIQDEIATGIQQQREINAAKERGEQGLVPRVEPVTSSMKALSLKVATGLDELAGIKECISEELWQTKKLERVVRREQIRNRLTNYAELEFIAIQRLIEQVENGKVTTPGELIAVAHLGAKMSHLSQLQAESVRQNASHGVSIDMQINQISSSHPNGDLPGAGHLGTIKLSLGSRVRSQLEAAIPMDKSEAGSYLEGIEMLTAKEVQKELLDSRNDQGLIIDNEEES